MWIRHSSSKRWMRRHVTDPYVLAAKANDVRSRSFFKLDEIQEKHRIIKPQDIVVDLGATPGGWSISATKWLKGHGKILAIDLLPMEPIEGVTFIQGDFLSANTKKVIGEQLNGQPVNVVLSDMLQNACGNHSMDHFRSMDIVRAVFQFAGTYLVKDGHVLCKALMGEDLKETMNEYINPLFHSVKILKPKSSRSESTEIYILASIRKNL